MDNTSPTLTDSNLSSSNCMNGSMRRPSPGPYTPPGAGGRPASLTDHTQSQPHVVRVVVNRDEKGYGMKVSGDNPVYVQSVKEGGAAERAGLHAGDKIIKVNGENVMQSTHTQVVALIKSSSQVVLTVQQRSRNMGSPSLHTRPVTTPTSSRITGPQPVDNEKQYQLQLEKEQYFRLMIEKEQHHVDLLRSQIASSPDEKKCLELAKTEKNLHTLQEMLLRSQSEQQSPNLKTSPCFTSLPSPSKHRSNTKSPSPNGNTEVPPPLPKRNTHQPRQRAFTDTNTLNNKRALPYVNGKVPLDINFLNNEINHNIATAASSPRKHPPPLGPLVLESSDNPPPLPPRASHSAPLPRPLDPDAVNSINKQMSYPLVATCATLVNDYSPNPTHHRTKSSPETLTTLDGADGSRKLSESMSDLTRQEGWERAETPPGTPPPPYILPPRIYNPDEIDNSFEEHLLDASDMSPFRGNGSTGVLANSSPIHAANPQTTQQPIMSMEDDEISDKDNNLLQDHGHFKSLSRLWEHLPHLAVFTNYVLSNSDPNSLMFYLLTDLYKEGNAKEMRKWAFEIHSCFLVPGAPLRLSNVDENIAREIDDVLTKEFDKEDRLRKIFWKARSRAKEELTRQLADFQHKRTAGLGTIFGPADSELSLIYTDKVKEIKLYESLFLEKLEPYLEEIDKENYDVKRYYTAAALTTILSRVFQIRHALHALDRCPTFVSREKAFKKLIGRRKLTVSNHQYVPEQYYTVIACNHCHHIIFGISPQGYECSVCHINLHRQCIKLYEDSCPGPIVVKKDRGIRKLIGMRDNTDHSRIKKTSHFIQMEKERRQLEERDPSFEHNESGEVKQSQPVSRSGSDRRPDAVREEGLKHQESASTADSTHDVSHDKTEVATPDSTTSLPATGSKRRINSNINRSESVKEQSEKRKQRRNYSDPSHNNTSGDVEIERHPGLSNTDSGSSSNSSISCNGRLSESPSNSIDAVGQTAAPRGSLESDSDMDVDTDPWQTLVPPEEFKKLPPHEKKRQDVINELFHTESSHVRNLKVLYKIFYKKLHESQILKPEELSLIFPNIKEVLDIHTDINKEMRRRRKEDPIVKEIGGMLTNMFDDRQGETFMKAAATFCERQQLALEFIRKRRERDSKFDALLTECEKKRQCRRLQLQGILPTEMQRLSKYPLLLERLITSIESNKDLEQSQQEELANLKRAHHMSKEILNYVNEAAKVALNRHRLEEIQKHLDTSNFERSDLPIAQDFKALDLTKYRLIIEGGMQLRRPNKAIVPVHVLLLEEAVIILHREGDRFLLKFFQSGNPAQPSPLSPIIKTNTLLVRTNAVCKNALFLVNTSSNNSQMFDLAAEDEIKREVWFKHFSDATEAYNKREGIPKRQEAATDSDDSESVQDLPPSGEVTERAEAVGGDDSSSTLDGVNETEDNDREEQEDGDKEAERESAASPEMVDGGGVETSKVSAEEWPLIQPSQVNIAVPPVHTTQSMVSPLEQIRRKDAIVKQALEDKEGLVADMMNIPRIDFQHIADMVSVENSTNRDPSELVMASICQVDQLLQDVNQSLNLSELEVVTAKGGKHPSCASQQLTEVSSAPLTVPVKLVRDVAASLSTQLTTLLSEVKKIEEERDQLRKELHRMREQIHVEHHLHSPIPIDDSEDLPPTTDCASEQHNPDDHSTQIPPKSDHEEEP